PSTCAPSRATRCRCWSCRATSSRRCRPCSRRTCAWARRSVASGAGTATSRSPTCSSCSSVTSWARAMPATSRRWAEAARQAGACFRRPRAVNNGEFFPCGVPMATLRLYLRLAHLLLVIALGAGLAALVSLCERLVRRDLMPVRQRLTRWFLARLSRALPFRVSIAGQLPQTPMLWVSNHVSWTDIPLLGALQPLSFLSKAEVRTWPLAGWLAHKAGTLFIRRGAGDSSLVGQQLTRHLQRGRPLLI